MTQNENILKHLRTQPITPIDALNLYGCFRLASRISELKIAGYDIKQTMIKRNNKCFAEYTLTPTEKQMRLL